MRSTLNSNVYLWIGVLGAAALSLAAPWVQATAERRISVPIALPFQHASSAATADQNASIPVIQPMVFTQTPQPVLVPVYSSAAASSNPASISASSPAPVATRAAVASSIAAKTAAKSSVVAPTKKTAPAVKAPAVAPVSIPRVTTAPIKAPRYPAGHPEAFVAEFEDYVAKKVAPFVPGVAVVIDRKSVV